MGDMANNDLEKYAKALDKQVFHLELRPCCTDHMFLSAIMKYHALKMEEVNDTMRHLWNKTYQGTGAHFSCKLILQHVR
jgi:DNA repair protein RAD50